MPVRVEVTTTSGMPLREVSLRLRAAGNIELKKQMGSKIRLATLPARQAVRAEEQKVLPKKGGLNNFVAKSPLGTSIMVGAKTAGVKITQRGRGHNISAMNKGHLRHPLFGDMNNWYSQSIPTGWWDRPLLAMAPVVRESLLVAMRETAAAAGFTDIEGL